MPHQQIRNRFSVPAPLLYGEILAASLILYAQNDKNFRAWLQKKTAALLIQKKAKVMPSHVIYSSALVFPTSLTAAKKRADWLMQEIAARDTLPGGREAHELLATWRAAQEKEDPKAIVIGLAIGIIPGPTLGQLFKKKRLDVLFRNDIVTEADIDVADMTTSAVLSIVARAFQNSDNSVKRLEPEFADWFFDSQDMEYHAGSLEQLIDIEHELREYNILNTKIEDERGIAVLAVSPVVHSHHSAKHWNLESLEI